MNGETTMLTSLQQININDVCFETYHQSDNTALLDMFQRCGPVTRKLFCPVPTFYGEDGLTYLTQLCGTVYVALYFESVLGVAYIYSAEGNYMILKDHMMRFGICIADPYQGQGIGTRFLQFLEGEAKTLGGEWLVTGGGTQDHGPLHQLLAVQGYTHLGYLTTNTPCVIVMEKHLT